MWAIRDSARVVLLRSNGRCEICHSLGVQLHHRQPRGMGGSRVDAHHPGNLLHVCHVCHSVIESRRESAYDCGWLVRHGDMLPQDTPVLLSGEWWTADDEGRWQPCATTV